MTVNLTTITAYNLRHSELTNYNRKISIYTEGDEYSIHAEGDEYAIVSSPLVWV